VVNTLPRDWIAIRREWTVLTLHQRFEAAIALVLTFVIWGVVLVALYRLGVSVVETLILKALNPLDHAVFQAIFGQIMTLLIALEFNHTLQFAVAGERGIIQARIVLVIAQLALARKVIVADLYEVSAPGVAALAALAVALAVAFRFTNESIDRQELPPGPVLEGRRGGAGQALNE
jgi:uncharacterized membrane protein (DUF373 family)